MNAEKTAYIKIFEPSEAKALYALIDKNRVSLGEFLPWVPDVVAVSSSEGFIQSAQLKFEKNKSFDCGIWVLNGGKFELAGSVGLHPIDWSNKTTAIGYWLGTHFRGKGLVTLACLQVCKHAFEVLQLNRIEIRCSALNLKSKRIPEALKFKEEGVLRQIQFVNGAYHNHVVYSLLASEWKNLYTSVKLF